MSFLLRKVKPLHSGHLLIADTFLAPDGVRSREVSLYHQINVFLNFFMREGKVGEKVKLILALRVRTSMVRAKANYKNAYCHLNSGLCGLSVPGEPRTYRTMRRNSGNTYSIFTEV